MTKPLRPLDLSVYGETESASHGSASRLVLFAAETRLLGLIRSGAPEPVREAVKIKINDGCREQSKNSADEKAANDRIAEWLANFGARTGTEHQRHATKKGGHGRHENGSEAQEASPADRINRTHVEISFGDDGKIHQHNPVLFHDAYQQDDADQSDQAEVEAEQH